jgi:hypothetical protein
MGSSSGQKPPTGGTGGKKFGGGSKKGGSKKGGAKKGTKKR